MKKFIREWMCTIGWHKWSDWLQVSIGVDARYCKACGDEECHWLPRYLF